MSSVSVLLNFALLRTRSGIEVSSLEEARRQPADGENNELQNISVIIH
jgi:hypothetical protein